MSSSSWHARAVVNAAGIGADDVRRLDDPVMARRSICAQLRGADIVLDRSFLPGETAIMASEDRRRPGAVRHSLERPRACRHHRHRDGDTAARAPTAGTRNRLSARPRRALPRTGAIAIGHPEHLRRPATFDPAARGPGIATSKMSREHLVVVSDSGLVTVTGGKWTTYRPMAVDAVDHAARVGNLPARSSATASLKLHGWREAADGQPEHMVFYGSDVPGLNDLSSQRHELSEPLHPALPYIAAEVVWAARHEAARTVEDVLARRTRPCSSTREPASMSHPGSRHCLPVSSGEMRTGRPVRSPVSSHWCRLTW